MDELEFLYENARYFVDVSLDSDTPVERDGALYFDYYIVVNKESGIVEHKCASLIEAISGAAMADATLTSQPWKFYARQADSHVLPETVQ